LTKKRIEAMPPSVNAPVAMIAATTWMTNHGEDSASVSGATSS